MPHLFASKLRELSKKLREYYDVISFYLEREFINLIVQKKFDFEGKMGSNEYYIAIAKSAVRGLLDETLQILRSYVPEVARSWCSFNAYMAYGLVPHAKIGLERDLDVVIETLKSFHEQKRYPPIPFVWRSDLPIEEKRAMIEKWLGKLPDEEQHKIKFSLDIGDSVCDHIYMEHLYLLAIYMPILDSQNCNFWLKEAELAGKYFYIGVLFHYLVENHEKPPWSLDSWLTFIKNLHAILKKP
ncbi:MAG: hypothetical protein ACTSXX_03495 [Candidatus Baldrarchaeia archaeon]